MYFLKVLLPLYSPWASDRTSRRYLVSQCPISWEIILRGMLPQTRINHCSHFSRCHVINQSVIKSAHCALSLMKTFCNKISESKLRCRNPSFIHEWHLLSCSVGHGGTGVQSQLSRGKDSVTPRTSHQFTAGPRRETTEELQIGLMCISLGRGRKADRFHCLLACTQMLMIKVQL